MKHTVKGYVTHTQSEWETIPYITFQCYAPDPRYSPDAVIVSEMEIEVEVPDNFDPREKKIANLHEKQRRAMADFQKLCTDIQTEISKLQAIE